MKRNPLPLLIGAAALLSGCSADTMEEPDEDWCLDPEYHVPLTVTVNVDNRFREYVTSDSIFTRSAGEKPTLKYVVAAYPRDSRLPIRLLISTDSVMDVNLHPGKYTFCSWVCLEQPRGNTLNYFTDDFNELLLKHKFNYSGDPSFKTAWRSEDLFTIPYNASYVSMTAKPAMAIYRLETTDEPDFEIGDIRVTYTSPLPAAVDGRTGLINWTWSGISYSSSLQDDLLAADAVLSQPAGTQVELMVEITDSSGEVRARKTGLEVELVNGGVTTVRGNFFSVLDPAPSPPVTPDPAPPSQGVGVDTKWAGTHVIEL